MCEGWGNRLIYVFHIALYTSSRFEMNIISTQKPTEMLNTLGASSADIRAQIERISSGPEIGQAKRLQELLSYIVEEFLAGRAERIKGFTIGQSVFATDHKFDPDSNSIVRVEMGRLRRRLAAYYLTSGSNDPIVIDIPKGSYVPRFSQNLQVPKESKTPLPGHWFRTLLKGKWLTLGAPIIVILLAVSWHYYSLLEHSISGEINHGNIQQPPKYSEAQIMFKQALTLLMPPEDTIRLDTSKKLFQRVIKIDPSFGGGYAGKSIAFSLGIIFLKSGDPENDLRQGLMLAESAVNQDPNYSLGYAALALAKSLSADTDSALDNVRQVIAIQPHEAASNAIASIALILSGRPSNAINLLKEALRLNPRDARTPYLNLLAVAQFVLGNYSAAAENIEKNIVMKGPIGPHMDVFLAATSAQMGNNFEAQAVIEKLQRTYPDYPAERWLGNFIKSESELQVIMSKLQSLGFPGS